MYRSWLIERIRFWAVATIVLVLAGCLYIYRYHGWAASFPMKETRIIAANVQPEARSIQGSIWIDPVDFVRFQSKEAVRVWPHRPRDNNGEAEEGSLQLYAELPKGLSYVATQLDDKNAPTSTYRRIWYWFTDYRVEHGKSGLDTIILRWRPVSWIGLSRVFWVLLLGFIYSGAKLIYLIREYDRS